MIAVDTNILAYAHRPGSPFFREASAALAPLVASGSWAIPWPCVHEFVALVTNPRVFPDPTPRAAAIEQVVAWGESPGLVLLAETATFIASWTRIVSEADIAGARYHDARVAAICIDHGVSELWTADRDFERFPALRTRNPLA